MAVNKIQTKIDNTQSQPSLKQKKVVQPYLNKTGAIITTNNVKPLPPQGYLIKDNLASSVKYFFKDIAYDMKAIKDGFQGNANDHQSGRLNDVGLKLGGVGIATYLASRTHNPKLRIMEFVGLGTFLASMSVYPKIAINTPAKLMHGYDIDKEYIDDQGRKKSVQQDSNYVPYDMYLGNTPDEDIALIGDKMGIPREIRDENGNLRKVKNRNDVIREQMRKIATQNNTLWMLTAGFATPLMTALTCCAIENHLVDPYLAKSRNKKVNGEISKYLELTKNMELDVSKINPNVLSKKINALLLPYKDKALPEEEIDNIIRMFTQTLDNNTTEGLSKDLRNYIKNRCKKSLDLSNETVKAMLEKVRINLQYDTIIPSEEELLNILKKHEKELVGEMQNVNEDEAFLRLRQSLNKLLKNKIDALPLEEHAYYKADKKEIINILSKSVKINETANVSEGLITGLTDFAKIFGEFIENRKKLDGYKNFKVEYAPDTVIAKGFNEFEQTFLKELGINFKDLKKMRESSEYTQRLLETKIAELCKNQPKYEKAMMKLGAVLSKMEQNLHGSDKTKSYILDLINAIENNYNNTAKRIDAFAGGEFKETLKRLVAEDTYELSNRVTSREQVFDFLDGLLQNQNKDLEMSLFRSNNWGNIGHDARYNYVKSNLRGLGSSKNNEIIRMFDRYQGAVNSMYRVIHTLEIHKRADENILPASLEKKSKSFIDHIIKVAKEMSLTGNSTNFTLKLNLADPQTYRDVFNFGWATIDKDAGLKTKGVVTKPLEDALKKYNESEKGFILDRYQTFISKFKDIIANSKVDFTRPNHELHDRIHLEYSPQARTNLSMFNLVGQSPVEMAKGAAGRRYGTQKWVRIVSTATAAVFVSALVAQFGFGKLRNPQNLQTIEAGENGTGN